MTKIKVDEKGLNARAMYRALNSDNWIIDDTQQSHPLNEPAEPNLVCEGDQIPMFSYDGETWERCVIAGDEYICPTGAETKMFWQIVKPMQESKASVGEILLQNYKEKIPALLFETYSAQPTEADINWAKDKIANHLHDKPTKTLQEAAEKYADEKTNKFSFGWDKEKAGRQLGFMAGATHQAPITKAKTIEDVVGVIKARILNNMDAKQLFEEFPMATALYTALTTELNSLLSQVKNI